MRLYEILLFVHVAAVVAWIGSGTLMHILLARASRAADPERLLTVVREAAWAGAKLFGPLSVIVLVFGILLVAQGPWDFSALWIPLGMAGYVVSAVTGMAILGPRAKKIEALAAERGAADPEVGKRARSLLLVMRLDLLVVYAVIFDMTVKPGI